MSWNRLRNPAALLVACIPMSGCSFLIHTITEPVAEAQVKRLNLPTSTAPAFSACLEGAGGKCTVATPSPLEDAFAARQAPFPQRRLDTQTQPLNVNLSEARSRYDDAPVNDAAGKRVTKAEFDQLRAGRLAASRAETVLNHPVQTALNEVFNKARSSASNNLDDKAPEPGAKGAVAINLRDFDDYLTAVEEATDLGGWDALALEGRFSDNREDDLRRQYIAAYFKAYFRNGRFYSVNLNGEELKKKIVARLEDALPGVDKVPGVGKDAYEKLADRLFTELKFNDQNQAILGKIASEGFVTRGGQDLKMPAVEAELDLASGKHRVTKIDTTAVTADLVRVLLHAIYDAHDRIPGVTNATGYGQGLSQKLGDNRPAATNVDEREFGEIEMRAGKVELVVSSSVGRFVRGLGVVALNNEALATAIETAIGVAARKHVEKVLWCWAACGLNAGKTTTDAAMTLPNVAPVDITIFGGTAKTIGVAKSTR